ncbi:MAG: TetR/AcrR family transcriptional regulator [Microbacterium sp.]
MPKVSAQYREARRDEIARAALRCLERRGVHDTSIADIVEESGLSTGAIYSHFASKAELARYIVARFLFPQVEALESAGARGEIVAPRGILTRLIRTFADKGLPPGVVLQFWGEAMVDSELSAEMMRTASRLRTSLTVAVLPWAEASGAEDPAALADETTRAIVSLAQGWIAHSAVFGPRDIDSYLASAGAVLAT